MAHQGYHHPKWGGTWTWRREHNHQENAKCHADQRIQEVCTHDSDFLTVKQRVKDPSLFPGRSIELGATEDQEDNAIPLKPFPTIQLHDDIEDYITI